MKGSADDAYWKESARPSAFAFRRKWRKRQFALKGQTTKADAAERQKDRNMCGILVEE